VDSFGRLLWWLFGSSVGAPVRGKVLLAIREEPRNAQQLAEVLGLDYTTIRHHLRVLLKNQVLVTSGPRYGQVYFLSTAMESHWEDLERIQDKFRKKGER
jgi:DNA-binding transcriptional ArsR family regulator